jgi:hypothetical protein
MEEYRSLNRAAEFISGPRIRKNHSTGNNPCNVYRLEKAAAVQ